MLAANVLCMKKRKKRSYRIADAREGCAGFSSRSNGGAVTMLQITEDTPPDMLTGAMDLTVHLPNGRAVKTSVERSTPMMDLLVQITTRHNLQLSNYTLQALGMAPNIDGVDKVLPFKPNTPIGALDTQHIKVLPKNRTNVKPSSNTQQPFENTFRLKVHLPRNQLYVTRVSRMVLLEDIMRKVCEEKNLDPGKYEFKHPGNLDRVLDPKLTLSDYQITEIFVVAKGCTSLSQSFSTNDIMVLRKEEERKQLHTKTGGGVFNLIFRRGKSSGGSGSVSSENRSISPTRSDDSRSVTPPTVQPQIIVPKQEEKPKAPQRKRRPAPKPPALEENSSKTSSNISDSNSAELQSKKSTDSLTICHSRNSSDSSGYHEASILSDNCNTSLPRRPKSLMVNGAEEKLNGEHSQSATNLASMSSHSKSTSSLAFAGRKKKAAPPPPPAATPPAAKLTPEPPSHPVVASPQPVASLQHSEGLRRPVPTPRKKAPRPNSVQASEIPKVEPESVQNNNKEEDKRDSGENEVKVRRSSSQSMPDLQRLEGNRRPPSIVAMIPKSKSNKEKYNSFGKKYFDIGTSLIDYKSFSDASKKNSNQESDSLNSEESALKAFDYIDEIEDFDQDLFDVSPKKESYGTNSKYNQLFGIYNYESDQAFLKSQDDLEDGVEVRNHLVVGKSSNSESASSVAQVSSTEVEKPKDKDKVEEKEEVKVESVPEEEKIESSKVEEIEIAEIVAQEPVIEEVKSEISELCDWQYQLPAPPNFRDASPERTESTAVVPDSVVTSPELFEKKVQSDKESDLTSVVSEEEKLLNKLSLENLEKRKSLVYNRELATSLKMTDSDSENRSADSFDTSLNRFNSTFEDIKQEEKRKVSITRSTSTLPNFKISTYDPKPKTNIKVFEDDTVRSNSNRETFRKNTENEPLTSNKIVASTLKKNFGRSMENLSYRNSDVVDSIQEIKKPESKVTSTMIRSESFSAEKNWSPSKAVSRSKSFLTVNKPAEDKMSKHNSLFDVSGLQSLEIMKNIQNRLNTPTGSTEDLDAKPTGDNKFAKAVEKPALEPKPYIYKPPLINMASWAERPKVSVSLKEDSDYVLNNNRRQTVSEQSKLSSKLIVNTTKSNVVSNNVEIKNSQNVSTSITKITPSVNVRVNGFQDDRNVSVKINGSEPISSQNSGNVLIKIGNQDDSRKPFGTLNKNKPRPHSMAFGQDFDISRVPVVKSMELKKPFRDAFNNNTSVTQINYGAFRQTNFGSEKDLNVLDNDKIIRTNTFGPTVRGFQLSSGSKSMENRASWGKTLPSKPKNETQHSVNSNIPFSQSNLRRTESNKILTCEKNSFNIKKNGENEPKKEFTSFKGVKINNEIMGSGKIEEKIVSAAPPPPPPAMPKEVKASRIEESPDARDQLLSAIRNFGGKKGLKPVRA